MLRRIEVATMLVTILILTADMSLAAFDPAQVFDKKCSSCHTVGGGELKGPDLKDVTKRRAEDWLIRFIQSSADVIESGEIEAVKLYNEYKQKDMPDQRLTAIEVRAMLKFIEAGGAPVTPVKSKSALEAGPEDMATGRRLFLGDKRFANGAPSCVSCHSAGAHGPMGGGTLGKNLTSAYSAYKDQGLSTALGKMAFPVMQEIFAVHPLTDDELFAVKAFLFATDREGTPAGHDPGKKFLFLGVGGAVFLLGVIDFIWRRRRKSSVRRFEGGIR